MRASAAETLGAIGEDRAVFGLIRVLADDDAEVVKAAEAACARSWGPRSTASARDSIPKLGWP